MFTEENVFQFHHKHPPPPKKKVSVGNDVWVCRKGRIPLPQIKKTPEIWGGGGGELPHTQVPKPKIHLSLHKFTFYSAHVYQYSNIIKNSIINWYVHKHLSYIAQNLNDYLQHFCITITVLCNMQKKSGF
jgi:hypothetical protein